MEPELDKVQLERRKGQEPGKNSLKDDQSSEEESKNGAKESVDKKSLKIMLKLMEGMQELQRADCRFKG